jgi:hypothetical protein
MAAERPGQTVIDYVTIALSPALIVGLISSLVLFLLEVFYRTEGAYKERLQWILFFYVFGAVLNARLHIEGNSSPLAPLYAPALALLTFYGMQSFVTYPPGVQSWNWLVNLALVGIVWWCARKLTWDCTHIDEQTDMSGEGLLQAAGLEDRPESSVEPSIEVAEEDESSLSWFERYRRYQERKNKKRILGVWVVYFSLAALPLFGLGQSLIPVAEADRRRFAFLCLVVYVACGLGLLLTTSFLGLRRYLRQKRLQMPAAMTGAWLLTGGTLIAGVLIVALVLPRPYPEVPLVPWTGFLESKKQKSSRFAVKGDSPSEEQGESKAQSKQQQPDSQQSKQSDSSKSSDKQQGRDQTDKGQGKEGKQGKAQSKDGQQHKEGGDKKQQGDKSEQQQSAEGKQTPPPATNPLQNLTQRLAPILKWIVFALFALVVLIALFRATLGFLAPFTDWARRWLQAWQNFWAGLRSRAAESEEEDSDEDDLESLESFSDFSNPFASGQAKRLSARKLVRYSFAALEAWARDRDLARRPNETAREFAERLGEEVPALEAALAQLAELQARAEYAPGELPDDTVPQLESLWQQLDRSRHGSLAS